MEKSVLQSMAAAAVKTAAFFSSPVTANDLGHGNILYSVTVGFETPRGVVLCSEKKSARDLGVVERFIDASSKKVLAFEIQEGGDRDTSALDTDPRVKYYLAEKPAK